VLQFDIRFWNVSSTSVPVTGISFGRLQFYIIWKRSNILQAVDQLIEVLRYKPECRGFDSRWYREFFIDIILPVALSSWGDSTSNRNEYQEYFLKVKAADA